jgi:hypothetical protein
MPIKITAYKCQFLCKRVRANKSHIIAHEKVCFNNPANRACQTCEYYKEDWDTFYNPDHGGNPGSTDYEVKYKYCSAIDDFDIINESGLQHDCVYWKAEDAI